MGFFICLLILLALTRHSCGVYCVCKANVSDAALQKSIDYACGNGADCSAILQTGGCYQPNTVKSHCDYAVNSYFQRKSQINGSCDFSGTAMQSASLPTSQYSILNHSSIFHMANTKYLHLAAVPSTCVYQATPGTTGTPTGTGTTTPIPTGGGTGTGSANSSTGTGTTFPSPGFSMGPTGIGGDGSSVAPSFKPNNIPLTFVLITGLVLMKPLH